jgi:hypothetical protein
MPTPLSRSIQIAKEFNSKTEFILAALKIKIPGYGFGGLDSDSNIYTVTIEIPQKDTHRYITAIEQKGVWRVVDDFVGPIPFHGTAVKTEGRQLIYRDHKGAEFRRMEFEKSE